jgi:hypothetical protein
MTTIEITTSVISILVYLSVYSLIYKDNTFYRFIEHLCIGAGTGYMVISILQGLAKTIVTPIQTGDVVVYIPIILGLLVYMRYFKSRARSLYFIPIALLTGVGTSLSIRGILTAQLLDQIKATIKPPSSFLAVPFLNYIIMFVGTITVICYFFFTIELKGPLRAVTRTGRFFIFTTMGGIYGMVVLDRATGYIGVMTYMLDAQRLTITIAILSLMIITFVIQYLKTHRH